MIDWYERRDELEPGQIFRMHDGLRVKLDRRVPGDGTKWYVADWLRDHWSYEDDTIEPGDLAERIIDVESKSSEVPAPVPQIRYAARP